MIQYIFIPKTHEALLANAVQEWLKNPNAWTVITGEYQECTTFDDSISPVVNRTLNGDVQYIKNGFESLFTGQKFQLIGFCVEGDLQCYTPTFYAELLNLSDVLMFNSVSEYRNAINIQYHE
jgi:hypothetical protein